MAEFYRELFGLTYRPGDEAPPTGEPDPKGDDWLVLRNGDGIDLAFQKVESQPVSTWPSTEVPQMLHLDSTVATLEELEVARDRAVELGARIVLDRADDPEEELYVFADPAGHPFCIFVSED